MTKIKSADNPTPNKIVLNEIVTCPEDNGERTDDPMQSVKNKTNTSTKQCQRLKRGVDVFIVLPNDPSSATASAARVERIVRSRTPATRERTAERPFAAAHG